MKKLLLLLLSTVSLLNAESLSNNLWKYTFFSLDNNIITIPEYLATYVVELAGYFFIIVIGFEILILTFKYFSTGFNIQQLKPMLIQSFVSLIIVVGVMFTPGVKETTFTESNGQTNTIRTKLLVDLTSALFASGSVIADVFAYEILFGKMPENKNLFTDGFKGANKNTKLEGYLIKMGIYSAYNAKNQVTFKFKDKNKNIKKMFSLMENLLSKSHLDKYKKAKENLEKSQQIIISIINNKLGNEASEINFGNNNSSYIVKNNNLTFKYKDFDGNQVIINEDNEDVNNNITDKRIINFNKKVILSLSKEIDKTNNKYMDTIINLQKEDLQKLYGQKSFFNNNYYTIIKNDMLNNQSIYDDNIKGNEIYKMTKDYINGNLPYNLDSFSNFITTLTKYSNENKYLDKKTENIKDKINQQKQNNYFVNNLYSNFFNYYFNTVNKAIDLNLPDNLIQTNQNYIKSMNIFKNKLYNDSNKWLKLQSKINQELSNANNKTTLTLNDLYKRSSILSFFKMIGIGGTTIDELITADTLPNDYVFHWWDLGNYYSGLKSVISNNYFTTLFLNDLLINKDVTEDEMNKFVECLQIDPNSRNNGECKVNGFHSYDAIKTVVDIGKNGVNKTKDAFNSTKINDNAFAIVAGTGIGAGLIIKTLTNTKGKGLLGGGIKMLFDVLKLILILLLITVSLYVFAPLVFWFVAIINWFLKSSILLVSFCLSFIFLLIENKRQVVYNNIFHLIGQAMIPLFLVGMFFLIINLSNILDIAIFNALPLGSLALPTESNESARIIVLIIKYIIQGMMNILNIILTFNLFRYLWQVDEFVSEVIGTQVNNSLIQPEKIVHTFSGNQTEKFF